MARSGGGADACEGRSCPAFIAAPRASARKTGSPTERARSRRAQWRPHPRRRVALCRLIPKVLDTCCARTHARARRRRRMPHPVGRCVTCGASVLVPHPCRGALDRLTAGGILVGGSSSSATACPRGSADNGYSGVTGAGRSVPVAGLRLPLPLARKRPPPGLPQAGEGFVGGNRHRFQSTIVGITRAQSGARTAPAQTQARAHMRYARKRDAPHGSRRRERNETR